MATTMTCHVESVAGNGVASVVVTCQRVEEPRGIRRRKWSRVMAITVVCQGVMEPHKIRQEVEQSHGRYCGLSGSDGAMRNPSQEVE